MTVGIHTELTREKRKEITMDIIQIAKGISDYAAMICIMSMESANTKTHPHVYTSINVWNVGICLNKYLKD